MLLGKYFNIEQKITEGENNITYFISLNPSHKIYQGHFPDMPVCPGVCNIQTIKECIQQEIGKKLILESIAQCKFSSLITPKENNKLRINILILDTEDNRYKVKVNISNPENTVTFIDFKGAFRLK